MPDYALKSAPSGVARLFAAIKLPAGDPFALAGLVIYALFIATALAAPLIAPYDPTEILYTDSYDLASDLMPGEQGHILGTTSLGRDIFSQIVWGARSALLVGFTAASAHAVLPRLLARARERLPDVKLDLREMVTSAQIDGLMSGELDLGMARPPLKRPGLVSRPLLHEQLVVALPAEHPLSGLSRQLTLNDLDGQDLITHLEFGGCRTAVGD